MHSLVCVTLTVVPSFTIMEGEEDVYGALYTPVTPPFSYSHPERSRRSLNLFLPGYSQTFIISKAIDMSSPTYTQFHTATHPQHAHRHSSISSTTSTSSATSGPILSSAYRRDSTLATPATIKPRRASEVDLFAAQRDPNYSPFSPSPERRDSELMEPMSTSPTGTPPLGIQRDRRMSREWDASKVPPSKFQRPEGSIWATPASRDGHIARNKISIVVEKVKEKATRRK